MRGSQEVMLNVTVASIGELAVCPARGQNCTARIRLYVARSRDCTNRRGIVVLGLSEVRAIGGGGLGMLASLQHWAREHNIRFLLFHPSRSVQSKLKRARSMAEFYIASLEEMKALLAYANSRYSLVA